MNNRLACFVENNDFFNHNQVGYRKKHSTIDIIFILYMLAEYLKLKKGKLFCAFIDFKKTFDSVWRVGLCSKLINYNINRNFLNIIKSMYSSIKSCFGLHGYDYFACNRGLRQGENLSPILFFPLPK